MKIFLTSVGNFGIFSGSVFTRISRRKVRSGELIRQMYRVGVDSLSVVDLCALFIGLVLVLQTSSLLARFGAEGQVATIVGAAFVREIGPVFAAIMFAGRVGTGVAAEIGSMVVTEQVDAYRAFGLDPVAKLALPRVIAMTVMLPALTAISCLVGITGGYLLAYSETGVLAPVYLDKALAAVTPVDVLGCLSKGAIFGLLIGLIATYSGFSTPRTTEGVGEATTRSMVNSVLVVLVADLILTKFFMLIG